MARSLAEREVGLDTQAAFSAPASLRAPAGKSAGAFARLDAVALAVVYLVSAAALLGFATFGMHPELLVRFEVPASTYAQMMVLAPRGQIVLAFLALAAYLSRHVGTRWLATFVVVYLVSLGAELAGTMVGLPFG